MVITFSQRAIEKCPKNCGVQYNLDLRPPNVLSVERGFAVLHTRRGGGIRYRT